MRLSSPVTLADLPRQLLMVEDVNVPPRPVYRTGSPETVKRCGHGVTGPADHMRDEIVGEVQRPLARLFRRDQKPSRETLVVRMKAIAHRGLRPLAEDAAKVANVSCRSASDSSKARRKMSAGRQYPVDSTWTTVQYGDRGPKRTLAPTKPSLPMAATATSCPSPSVPTRETTPLLGRVDGRDQSIGLTKSRSGRKDDILGMFLECPPVCEGQLS